MTPTVEFVLDLRSGHSVYFIDQRRRRPQMTPPATDAEKKVGDADVKGATDNPGTTSGAGAAGSGAGGAAGATGNTKATAGGATGGAGGAGGAAAGAAAGPGGTKSTAGGAAGTKNATGGATGAGGAKHKTKDGTGSGGLGPPNAGNRGTPPPRSAPLPEGVVQLSSATLQQMLAAAVAAGAASVPAAVSAPDPTPKLPKFWESEPAAWFSVFRQHFEGKQLTQLHKFNRLLPLLPASAVSLCRPLVDDPPADVYTQAEALLLHHFELGPMERGKLLLACTSLGDRTPSAMLQYMRSLQPGDAEGIIFRYLFINLLPDVVREVVSSIPSLDDMATTAGNILQSTSSSRVAAALSPPETVSVAAVTSQRRPARRPPPPAARRSDVCRIHKRYGRDAFRCDQPDTCSMRNQIRTTPLPSGNSPAGGQ